MDSQELCDELMKKVEDPDREVYRLCATDVIHVMADNLSPKEALNLDLEDVMSGIQKRLENGGIDWTESIDVCLSLYMDDIKK